MSQADRTLVRKRMRVLLILCIALAIPSVLIFYGAQDTTEGETDILSIALLLFFLVPSGIGLWRIHSMYRDLVRGEIFEIRGQIEAVRENHKYGPRIVVGGRSFSPLPLEIRRDGSPLMVGTPVAVEELPESGLLLRIRVAPK